MEVSQQKRQKIEKSCNKYTSCCCTNTSKDEINIFLKTFLSIFTPVQGGAALFEEFPKIELIFGII